MLSVDENLLILEDGLIHYYSISPYETLHNGASRMGMYCLPMSQNFIVIIQDNCFIPNKDAH